MKRIDAYFDYSSSLYIDLNEIELIGEKYDKFNDVFEMRYRVQKLKSAIDEFGKWLEINRDNINYALENYHFFEKDAQNKENYEIEVIEDKKEDKKDGV